MKLLKPIKHKTIYCDGIKWVILGYIIKEREQRIITIKTDVRGQMNNICDFNKVHTIKIDETEYIVELNGISSSNIEEWQFNIIDTSSQA